MFTVPIDKIVPVTSARAKISSLVSDVQKNNTLYVLTRGGKPAAILASADFLKAKSDNLLQTQTKEEKEPVLVTKSDNVPEVRQKESTQLQTTDDEMATNDTKFDDEQPVKISIN